MAGAERERVPTNTIRRIPDRRHFPIASTHRTEPYTCSTMALLASRSLKAAGRTAPARRTAVRVQASSRVDRYSKNDIIVSPSILSADFSRLGDEASVGLAWAAFLAGRGPRGPHCGRTLPWTCRGAHLSPRASARALVGPALPGEGLSCGTGGAKRVGRHNQAPPCGAGPPAARAAASAARTVARRPPLSAAAAAFRAPPCWRSGRRHVELDTLPASRRPLGGDLKTPLHPRKCRSGPSTRPAASGSTST
jgi:hypothetical protein